MEHISPLFVQEHPECLQAKSAFDLLVLLTEKNDNVESLQDLMILTSVIEKEYDYLQEIRNLLPMTAEAS